MDRVSTVGIRNQVTIPNPIRSKSFLKVRGEYFLYTQDSRLILVEKPPADKIFNSIMVSEKGQMVVPKNLRESLGIREGVNLMFTSYKEYVAIERVKDNQQKTRPYEDFLSVLNTLLLFGESPRVEKQGNDAVLVITESTAGKKKKISDLVTDLEKKLGVRFILEHGDSIIKLKPIV